jgi:3-oxoacyl-[acyl-carrier protein] reductase
MNLRGKIAIVTGASRGIGAATAIELASQGVAVLLAARTLAEIEMNAAAINTSGGKAAAIACDVSDYAQVEAAVVKCQAEFGGLDILVNNAGVIDPIARLAESDPEAWGKAADINYKGVYYGLRAALPVMEKNGAGTIINISSGAATAALEGWSHYCSTKAAVLSLTKCADREYRDSGIRVLGLSPGTVATDMQIKIKASGVNPVSQLDPSVHIPADWPARAIAWLCADDDPGYLGTDVSLKDEATLKKMGLKK